MQESVFVLEDKPPKLLPKSKANQLDPQIRQIGLRKEVYLYLATKCTGISDYEVLPRKLCDAVLSSIPM